MMKLLATLLALLRRQKPAPVHDDSLRAGKEAADHRAHCAHWNSLLL
ncbi:MAG TPA: hypothetical protein VF450_03305 [Noviherbaspirillum sp.]